MRVPNYLIVIESNIWIFTILAFAHRYLNRPSKALNYLSEAAYPVYIIHMIFLYATSLFLFPLNMAIPLKFVLAVAITSIGCIGFYEFVIRRVSFSRPLFGLKRR